MLNMKVAEINMCIAKITNESSSPIRDTAYN